jgi:cysteine desulfurase/selenocysteine lyase
MLNVEKIKSDFPIFARTMREGKRLVYLDSGATSQKPLSVLAAEREFYEKHNAAVHRGAHQLAEEATDLYEGAREKVARFIGAESDEVIFTKNATESLNLLAYSWSNSSINQGNSSEEKNPFALKPGDEILISEMEHHANLIPWQELARRTGATLKWFGVTQDGRLNFDPALITEKTKIVALTHQSNVLGTINPIAEIAKVVKKYGAIFVVDACQSIPHFAVNVKDLGADFIAFSGHKALGPTGVGVLWGRRELLNAMPPFLTGGSMIETVTMERSTYASAPQRFEAGVPNMAQVIGLGAAIDYLSSIGMSHVAEHEHELTKYALTELQKIPGLSIVGPRDMENRGAVLSFTVEGIHPHDLGQVLDEYGIAVRTGYHCAWPLMRAMNVVATTRASFYLYNDATDVDELVAGISRAQEFFKTLPSGLQR